MRISLADWLFDVDVEQTMAYTAKCATDHCLCGYCRNFYQAVEGAHPALRPFLGRFGVTLDGPSELMPFEPTLLMAAYRVTGRIVRIGSERMHVDGVPIRPEAGKGGTFLLWVGELEVPWLLDEPEEEVISPANEPDFMARMLDKWLETREMDEIS